MRSSLDYFSAALEGIESFWWWTLAVFAAWDAGLCIAGLCHGYPFGFSIAESAMLGPLMLILWPFMALVGGWWAAGAGMLAMGCWLVPAYLGWNRAKLWALQAIVGSGATCALAIH